jgi:hypothetical protein
MAGGRRFASLAIVGILLVTGGVSGLKSLKTQDLFDEAYRPQDSRKFNLGTSESFMAEPSKTFDLSYADGTELQGFTGNDIVHLGNYHGMAPFGVIYSCNSPDFNGVDGILGFGLPKPGFEGRRLPRPILWALTDRAKEMHSNAEDLKRKFSFFSTDTAAELQLGGYDPATCDDEMLYTPSLSGLISSWVSHRSRTVSREERHPPSSSSLTTRLVGSTCLRSWTRERRASSFPETR